MTKKQRKQVLRKVMVLDQKLEKAYCDIEELLGKISELTYATLDKIGPLLDAACILRDEDA